MLLDAANEAGVSIGVHEAGTNEILRREKLTQPTDDERAEAEEVARQEYLAVAFLLGASRERFGKLITKIENDFMNCTPDLSLVSS